MELYAIKKPTEMRTDHQNFSFGSCTEITTGWFKFSRSKLPCSVLKLVIYAIYTRILVAASSLVLTCAYTQAKEGWQVSVRRFKGRPLHVFLYFTSPAE